MTRRQVVSKATQVVKSADAQFLQDGRSTSARFWVERYLLPMLEDNGLTIAPATAISPGRRTRTTAKRKPRRPRR